MVQTINNISNTASNILSIQVSLNGFSFCISDQDRQIIAVEQDNFGVTLTPNQMLDKIKFAFDNNPLLKKDFKTIEVIHQNDIYTLVPKVIFDANYTKDYLKYNCKILDNDFIAYDEVDQHDMALLPINIPVQF